MQHLSVSYISISSISLYMFDRSYTSDLTKSRTMVFTSLVLFELFFVFNCRSDRKSIWKMGMKSFTSNSKLVLAIIFSFIAQLLIIYVPALQIIFKTTPLSLQDWFFVTLAATPALFILPEKLIKSA